MIEISVDRDGFVKIPIKDKPFVILKNVLIIFTINEELADEIIKEFLQKGTSIAQLMFFNYDIYNEDITSFKKGLEKIFYHCIFINNDFVDNVRIFNVSSVHSKAIDEQIISSAKKITKNNGTKWPTVDDTHIKLSSFNTSASVNGEDIIIAYFYEIDLNSTDTELHIPIEGIPDGYPEVGEDGEILTYEKIIYYHNDWYRWPFIKNISRFYGDFISTESVGDNTLTIRSYKITKTEISAVGDSDESTE